MEGNKAIYIDERILKNFLTAVSKHLSHAKDNEVFIDAGELLKIFEIDAVEGWEEKDWKLGHAIEKINLIDSGVKAKNAFGGIDPFNPTSFSVENIKDWGDPTLSGVVFEVDIEKLKRNLRFSMSGTGKEVSRKASSKFIEEIICVEPEKDTNSFKVVINGDYPNHIWANKTKEDCSWDLLYEVARGGDASVNGSRKKNLDYFNNNKSNKIYTRTGYGVTKILKQEGEYVRAEENIKISTITEKTFKTRLNKFK